jgi:hypothetical protein
MFGPQVRKNGGPKAGVPETLATNTISCMKHSVSSAPPAARSPAESCVTEGDAMSVKSDLADPLFPLVEFHSNEWQAMLLRYQQIEKLIGKSHHASSEGDYCEILVREFLRAVLPRRFSADTGFIRRPNFDLVENLVECASPQLDIIIHDTVDYSPIFRSGDFVVVLPAAVVGVIEVKKRITSGELKKALVNLAESRVIVSESGPLLTDRFTAVVAFSAVEDMIPKTKSCSESYANRFREVNQEYVSKGKANSVLGIPEVVVVADQHALLRENKNGQLVVTRYPWTSPQPNVLGQLLIYKLFASLRVPEMSQMVNRFQFPSLQYEVIYPDPPAGS